MNVQKYTLSNKLVVYRAKFDWKYSKEAIIQRVKQNNFLLGRTDFNTTEIKIKSPEIEYINQVSFSIAKRLSNLPEDWNDAWAGKTWSYIQTPTSVAPSQDWHTHTAAINLPDTSINAPILTSWTSCFYLQVPSDLQGLEGALSLMDDDGAVFSIVPQEGDLIFFDGTVRHKPNLTPSSKENRIAICSNISFKITNLIKTS